MNDTLSEREDGNRSSSREKQRDKHEKRMGVAADLVPGFRSDASQSSESLVTLREEIKAQGSLDFHGSFCGHLVFSGEVSEMI